MPAHFTSLFLIIESILCDLSDFNGVSKTLTEFFSVHISLHAVVFILNADLSCVDTHHKSQTKIEVVTSNIKWLSSPDLRCWNCYRTDADRRLTVLGFSECSIWNKPTRLTDVRLMRNIWLHSLLILPEMCLYSWGLVSISTYEMIYWGMKCMSWAQK